jgi:hypothetical protein
VLSAVGRLSREGSSISRAVGERGSARMQRTRSHVLAAACLAAGVLVPRREQRWGIRARRNMCTGSRGVSLRPRQWPAASALTSPAQRSPLCHAARA